MLFNANIANIDPNGTHIFLLSCLSFKFSCFKLKRQHKEMRGYKHSTARTINLFFVDIVDNLLLHFFVYSQTGY